MCSLQESLEEQVWRPENYFFLFLFLIRFFRCLIGNFLSFCFLPLFWLGIFSFRFLSILLIGNFLLFSFSLLFLFFCFCFLLRARFMVSWDCGSRLIERLDMTYVSFGQRFGGKGDLQHYFHDTNATMMIWKFYARLVMHAPMWTLKHQVFMVTWH